VSAPAPAGEVKNAAPRQPPCCRLSQPPPPSKPCGLFSAAICGNKQQIKICWKARLFSFVSERVIKASYEEGSAVGHGVPRRWSCPVPARRGSTPRTPASLRRRPHLGRALRGRARQRDGTRWRRISSQMATVTVSGLGRSRRW